MAQLNLIPPLISQTQESFNASSSIALTSIQNWSSLTSSTILVDYLQDSNNNFQKENFTYGGTAYQPIPNFTFNFTPKNPVSIVNLKLTTLGVGYIGIFINGLLFREIPFNNASFADVNYNRNETFAVSSNKIGLSIRATSGSVSVASSKIQPFLNYLQLTNINS